MEKGSQIPLAPIKALQARTAVRTRWVLLDPGLRGDCVAAYRTVRLLLLTLFALLSAPLHAETISNQCAGREVVSSRQAATNFSETNTSHAATQKMTLHAVRSKAIAALERHTNDAQRRQEMACLEISRAHAPPVRKIPDEPFTSTSPAATSHSSAFNSSPAGAFSLSTVALIRNHSPLHPYHLPLLTADSARFGLIFPQFRVAVAALLCAFVLQITLPQTLPSHKGDTYVRC
jgi:hypothetical protein